MTLNHIVDKDSDKQNALNIQKLGWKQRYIFEQKEIKVCRV